MVLDLTQDVANSTQETVLDTINEVRMAKAITNKLQTAQVMEQLIREMEASQSAAVDENMMMEALLDYTAFKEIEAVERPNPFDDPLVGAVLADENLKILGVHRKEGPNERHAEPNAIISALIALDDDEARKFIFDIENHYKTKS